MKLKKIALMMLVMVTVTILSGCKKQQETVSIGSESAPIVVSGSQQETPSDGGFNPNNE